MDDDAQLESTLKEAYDAAPPYIRDYLQSGKFDAFMSMLTSHYGLHADVAGRAENEILMTIIGMIPPNELEANLQKEAGVAPGLVAPILEELNKEVFIPLRDSLRNTPEPAAAPAPAPAPQPQERQWVDVTPPVVPAPTTPTIPPVTAPVPPAYVPPVQSVPVPPPVVAPVVPAPTPVAAPSATAAPEYHELHSMMRTMSKDIEALKNGVQPTMQPWKPLSVPTEPASVPVAPISQPVVETPSIPHVQTVPTPIVHERIITPAQSGGGDPYREPIE